MKDLYIARKMVAKADNAKQRGIEFTLTFADVKKLVMRKTCYYTKNKLEEEGNNKRTFDRIDSRLGYTKDNTVACTSSANKLKNRIMEELEIDISVVKHMIDIVEKSRGKSMLVESRFGDVSSRDMSKMHKLEPEEMI